MIKITFKGFFICFIVGILLWSSIPVSAAKFPMSTEGLIKVSDLIIKGTVLDINIRSDKSYIEKGFGNYDWIIDLEVELSNVEKGIFDDDSITIQCFRTKSRKSLWESFSPAGHSTIPEIGSNIIAYLYKDNDIWAAQFPNGIQAASKDVVLKNHQGLSELKSRSFTFLLPIESWILIVILSFIIYILILFLRRIRSKLNNKKI